MNPYNTDNSSYAWINNTGSVYASSSTPATSRGFFLANSSSTALLLYWNPTSTSVGFASGYTPTAVVSQNLYVLARNNTGAADNGSARQVFAASAGGALGSDALVVDFYNRLNTFKTAIGSSC
jgi:hypothetical protein